MKPVCVFRLRESVLAMLLIAAFDRIAGTRALGLASSLRIQRHPCSRVTRLFATDRDGEDQQQQQSKRSSLAYAPLSQFTSLQNNYQSFPIAKDVIPLRENQRLVCMGDVHGDYVALKDFLELSGVYDGTRWIGGDTILVQCGDVLDRGSEELKCFSLLSQLSLQAQKAGGQVVLLWGNHEALNSAGLFHYSMGDAEYEAIVGRNLDTDLHTNRWRLQFAGNQPARWATFEPGGLLSQPLMMNMKVAVQVGKTVCVHAGLTKQHMLDYGGLEGMNKMARDWVQEAHHGRNNNLGSYDSVDQVLNEASDRAKKASKTLPACLGGGIGASSPVWMRDYSFPPNGPPNKKTAQGHLDDVLSYLKADRMVVGHTVQSRINAALQGKVWRVDVGASRGVAAGMPEVLEIIGGEEEVVHVLTRKGRIPAAEREIVDVATSLLSRL